MGGAGTYVQNIGREMTKQGHDISVICAKYDKNISHFKDGLIQVYPIMDYRPSQFVYFVNKVPFIKLLSGGLFYLHNGLKIHLFLRKLNHQNPIDFIEYSEGGDFWNALTKKFKYSSHLHGSNYTFKNQANQNPDLIDSVRRKLEHVFIKGAQKVISPSRAMVGFVENEMESILTQAHIIPYPILNISEEFGNIQMVNKKVSLLFASRNDPVKGGDLLIRALELLPNSLKSKICVEFYGYESKQDISHITFLSINGFVKQSELNKVYKKTNICVIPSLFDNSPNTVYEAMAYGKIVVASKVGGIPEIVGEGKNGYLFKPGDERDLCKKLTKAINLVLEGKSKIMTENAQRWIWKQANIKDNVQLRMALIQ